jgi:CHAD domain-containing protein
VKTYRPDSTSLADLSAALCRAGGAEVEVGPTTTRTFYDTFDWRVFRRGGTVAATGDEAFDVTWSELGGKELFRAQLPRAPAFAEDLPPGPFREELQTVIKVRRLLPVVRIREQTRIWTFADADGAAVAEVRAAGGRAMPPRAGAEVCLPPLVRIRPAPGQAKKARRLTRSLERQLHLRPTTPNDLDRALSAIGRTPGDYTSKRRIELDPEDRADRAMQIILGSLHETMARNEAGVKLDLDPEFLHDFRVASRRTRATLTAVKGVFPPDTAARFRTEFEELGRATGPTRDLDVYLLQMPRYQADLPAESRGALEPLRGFLLDRQRAEHEKMVKMLESRWYRSLMQDWQSFLEGPLPMADAGRRARWPVSRVARKRIRKALKRVLTRGAAITDESPAEDLHQLRIECKKLRYLMESFGSLFPADVIGLAVADLKVLQDDLGEFNDLEIQRHTLRRFALEMAEEGSAPAETLLALGQLVERLGARQQEARARFGDLYAQFSRPANRRRFVRLFGSV